MYVFDYLIIIFQYKTQLKNSLIYIQSSIMIKYKIVNEDFGIINIWSLFIY